MIPLSGKSISCYLALFLFIQPIILLHTQEAGDGLMCQCLSKEGHLNLKMS